MDLNFIKNLQNIMRQDKGVNGDAQRLEQIVWLLFLKIYDIKEQDWEVTINGYNSIIPDELKWRNWAHNRSNSSLTGDELINFIDNKLFKTLKNIPLNEDTPNKHRIVKEAFEEINNYMKDGTLLRKVINVIDDLDLSEYKDRHVFGDIYEKLLSGLQSAGNSGEFYTPRALTDFIVQVINPNPTDQIADFACGTGGFLISSLKLLETKIKSVQDREIIRLHGNEVKQLPYILCLTNMLLHEVDSPEIEHINSLERNIRDYTENDKFDVIIMNPPFGGSEKKEILNNFPLDLRSSETADLFVNVIMYRLKYQGRAAVILPDGFLFQTDSSVKINIKKKLLEKFNLHTIIRLPNSVFAPYTSISTNILFFENTKPTSETWYYRFDMPEGYKHFSKTKPILLKHFDPVFEWLKNKHEIIDESGNYKAKKYTLKEIIDNNYNLDLCGYPHETEEILPPEQLISEYLIKQNELNQKIDKTLSLIKELINKK